MNCLELLSVFLRKNNISEDKSALAIKKIIKMGLIDNCDIDYVTGEETIIKILTDVYFLNSQKVKTCANIISKRFSSVGRHEKDLIKHYLDYQDNLSFDELLSALHGIGVTSESLTCIIEEFCEDQRDLAISSFLDNWNAAVLNDDETKLFDYLQGIYTRLVNFLNEDVLSLNEIYNYNRNFINEELNGSARDQLLSYCASTEKIPAAIARKQFCDKYEDLLTLDLQNSSKNNTLESVMNLQSAVGTPFATYNAEEFKLVIININQKLYDTADSENAFWNKVLSLVYYSYRVLENHRTLAICIDNIIASDGRNLKWLAYSYIGIYGEHFIPTKEKRRFYCAEELCFEKCAYWGIELSNENKAQISKYYVGGASKASIEKSLNLSQNQVDDLLLDFENVWYGYTFSDCLSVVSGEYPQHPELQFIKNNNQLVLIFNKYRHDDRKIPCPECAGLDISGNSFPEVGLRSWECKNSICPSRSKSNRGKRYSKKSNFMQWGFDFGNEYDQISRDLIKLWRRDISAVRSSDEITDMLVRYFSFDTEPILLINFSTDKKSIVEKCHRTPNVINTATVEAMSAIDNIFSNYFSSGKYVRRYLDQKTYPLLFYFFIFIFRY